MIKGNGGTASPVQWYEDSPGMSLRDWLAGQAFAGMCGGRVLPRLDDGPEMAKRAYAWADAMLEAREK